MRMTRSVVTLLSLSAVLVASLAFAGATMAGGRPFTTQLSGAAETGPGDPDGSGTASITLNPGTGQVCYDYTVTNVAPLTAGHIHEAPAGASGGIVIDLELTSGSTSGSRCVSADREQILEIIRNPSDYYVNVHNAAFPAGAVRGQLSR